MSTSLLWLGLAVAYMLIIAYAFWDTDNTYRRWRRWHERHELVDGRWRRVPRRER